MNRASARDLPTTITPEEVAAQLGYSRKRIYQFLDAGQVPGTKIGKKWIINRASFYDWFSRRESHPSPAPPAGAPPDISGMLSQLDNVRDLLRQFSAVVEGAIAAGIEDILPPRRSGHRTREVISAALDRARGDVWVQGITLREFFSDKDYELILRKRLVQNEPFYVRAVMQDPLSEAARARALAERGSPYRSEEEYRQSNLFIDTHKSINRILLLTQEAATRQASNFDLSVRFVSDSTLWAVCTEHVAFVEFYHFGRPQPDAWFNGSCLGESVPILQVRAGTDFYNVVRSHIEYFWRGDNPFIHTCDVETMSARLFPPG